jgi:hypothetical protein
MRRGATLSSAALVVLGLPLVVLGIPHLASPDRSTPVVELSAVARASLTREHDEPVPAPPEVAPGPGASTVSVDVPAGPLTIVRGPSRLTLQRVEGTDTFRGVASGVLVIDTRGTSAGWRLVTRLTPIGPGPTSSSLQVDKVVATAASVAGLRASASTEIDFGRWLPLVVADPGSGNGSYDVTFSVDATLSPSTSDRLELDVALSLR